MLKLRYYYFLETLLDGIPVIVTRTGWTGEVGYEIYLRDGSRGDELGRIMDAGKPHQIRPTGPGHPSRRGRILNWGADGRRTTFTKSGWNGSWTKTSRALRRQGRGSRKIRRKGVTRKLVGVEIAGDPFRSRRKVDRESRRESSRAHQLRGLVAGLKKNIGYACCPWRTPAAART